MCFTCKSFKREQSQLMYVEHFIHYVHSEFQQTLVLTLFGGSCVHRRNPHIRFIWGSNIAAFPECDGSWFLYIIFCTVL